MRNIKKRMETMSKHDRMFFDYIANNAPDLYNSFCEEIDGYRTEDGYGWVNAKLGKSEPLIITPIDFLKYYDRTEGL